MAKDLTIRILGRPQVTKDDAVGYQRISRQYVVEGYRASYAGINDPTNPLFLAVGTQDEEFEGHYLVDQKISPKQGSVDVAYLTREFVEIRDTWSSEQYTQSNGFKRCSRMFVALRASGDLGYSETNFQYHPSVSPQKEDNPWKYAPNVVLNSEPTISEVFNIPTGVQFNQKWHRASISVDTKTPGIDIWSVSWASPIRPEGEPTITKDTAAGYQTVSRAYVVSAEFYNKNKIFDDTNPLFLSVGTADHEYDDHYLVNQQIKPMLNTQKEDSEIDDLAILTREFVQIRDTWSSEQFAQSRGFKKLTRVFVALRAENDLGYSTANFEKHPQNSPQKDSTPWEYLPKVVVDSEPSSSDLFQIPVGVEYNHYWHRSSVSVDTKAPGIDVWSVSWTAPIRPEGEPTITKDNQLGYQTVKRSYAISSDFYTKNKIFDETNPLFIDVGTADHEYTDHYLVNQQISPLLNAQKDTGDSTQDLAILTREFVQIRNTWSAENFSQSRGFKRLSRTYVVLRNESDLGYSEANFQYHPENNPQKESSPWKYLPKVIADSEPSLSELFNIPSGIEFNQKWHRSSISVDTKNPGVDIWNVTWMAPIRPEGEPTITKDSQIGYQTVQRTYAISGDYYAKNKIFDPTNPLFLSVGTADHEYADHYLVDQQIRPLLNTQKDADDTVEDLALLTRVFVEIRDTYTQESISTSGGLRRLRRTFVALRAVNASVGYETQVKFDSRGTVEPWAYAPNFVKDQPANVAFSVPADNPMSKSPRLGGESLNTTIGLYSDSGANSGEYLPGSCRVDTSRPGVDVWSVEWVTHTAPFWSNGGTRSSSVSSNTPKVVSFDSNGLRIVDYSGGQDGTIIGEVATFTFYVVSDQIPVNLAATWVGKNSASPSVMLDFTMTAAESNTPILKESRVIPNAMFNYGTGGFLNFPTMEGGNVRIGSVSAQQITFEGSFQNVEFAGQTLKKPISQLPMYQFTPIVRAGGTISWQLGFEQTDGDDAGFMGTNSSILFNSSLSTENKKIWRVVLTYVG